MGEHILEHDRKSSKSEGLTPAAPFRERGMKALHKRCAGLDVHKVEVVACLRLVSKRKVGAGGAPFPDRDAGAFGA